MLHIYLLIAGGRCVCGGCVEETFSQMPGEKNQTQSDVGPG